LMAQGSAKSSIGSAPINRMQQNIRI